MSNSCAIIFPVVIILLYIVSLYIDLPVIVPLDLKSPNIVKPLVILKVNPAKSGDR